VSTVAAPRPVATPAVLAFDFGTKRIGVAVGDRGVGIAHPVATVEGEDNASRFTAIDALVAEWRPGTLVVGLPLALDGTEHELTRLSRKFARRLETRYGLPVEFVDERLSSAAAEEALREAGAKTRGSNFRENRGRIDRLAAQILLQQYLDAAQRSGATR
jgi:putative Holliday junction resolvase